MRVVVMSVPAPDAELAADRLWTAGGPAVEERSHGDTVELRTVLGDDDQVSLSRLGDLPTHWRVEIVDVDDEPAQTWREFAQPIRVDDDLVVVPAWLDMSHLEGSPTVVAIEPGAAFGLGDHPTTILSGRATWRLAGSDDRLLDVGCGTGVLAVIGALRGAQPVVAIDISEAARSATLDNARRNGVADVVAASCDPVAAVDGEFDLVVANILAPELIGMAEHLRRLTAPGGRLVLSGLLAERYHHVVDALAPMVVVDVDQLEGWAAVQLRHP